MSGNDANPYQPFESDEEPLDIQSESALPPQAPVPGPEVGSRPADGARQVSPGEILSEDLSGGENAGDFLGLDLEFDAPSGVGAPGVASGPDDLGGGTAPMGDSGTAFELSSPPGMEAGLDSPQLAPEVQAGISTGTPVLPDPSTGEPLGDVDFQPGSTEYTESYGEEGELDEFGQPIEGELDEEGEVEEAASGRGRLLLLTVAVMAVAFGGVWYGRDFLPGSKGGGGTQIAQQPRVPTPDTRPSGPATSGSNGDPVAVDTTTEPPTDPIDPLAFGPGTPDTTGTQGRPVDPTELAVQEDALVGLTEFLHGVLVEGEGAPTGLSGGPTVAELPVDSGFPSDPVAFDPIDPTSVQGEVFESLDWADPGALDIVWRGDRVPMEAIASPAKVMLPRVGRVRLHLDSGETMDGRVVAVGQASVWIDTGTGRIGLGAEKIVDIEHLQPLPFGAEVEPVAVATGDEVRVTLPGGAIFARVLSNQEGLVTVQTENGAKITLRDPEMERVKSTRVHVVELPEQPEAP